MKIPWTQVIPSGGRIFIGGGACVPFALVENLLGHAEQFRDVEIVHIHTLGETPWIDIKYEGNFRTNSFFLSESISQAVNEGRADYTPSPMSEIPWLFENKTLPLDAALVQCSPPDGDGMVSLGLSADVLVSAVASAKRVVAQINPLLPKTTGDTLIPFSEIDYFLEHAAEPIEMLRWNYDHRHKKIGKYAAQLVDDGSTLQASMGDTPQSVLDALQSHRHLGIHTGCFTNAMMRLVKAGAVDNSMKSQDKGICVASHCLGSKELYQFVEESEMVALHGSRYCNNPERIAEQYKMVAINGSSEVDLTGQVVRDSRGHHFYGGIGATQDFIRGAAHSKGGRPIVVLTSTTDEGDSSRIVTGLSPGSGVCTSRGDTHYVVTEYGIANLVGRSIRERVLQLVEVAHPRFRESLLEGARLQGWIPKTFNISPRDLEEKEEGIDSQRRKFGAISYLVRPIHSSDMRLLQELFYSQDEETIRLRYGYARQEMNSQVAYKTASVDQSTDLALGVFYKGGHRDKLRAVARFYRDEDPSSAEISFLVHERARRRGMANFLLTEMAKVAKERGIKTFWASVLKDNGSMAGLFEARGAKRESPYEDESFRYVLDVDELLRTKDKTHRNQRTRSSQGKSSFTGSSLVGVYFSEKHLLHDTGYAHPESAERYRVLLASLKALGDNFVQLPERKATVKEIHLAHSPFYHDMAKMEIENFAEQLSTGDTAVCEESYHVAVLATGSLLAASDAVMKGKVARAFCAVRPPGHHATEFKGMGFCIFNHAAVAARYLQSVHKIKKVAILDWDVHHGNGTQDIFYQDPSVFYFSTHQEGIFPGTGHRSETGDKGGKGTTLNVPLKRGAGDKEVIAAWHQLLQGPLKKFNPEIVILSAGFDAAAGDPLGQLKVTPQGFAELTKMVKEFATKHCRGRVLSVLEGGYAPPSLAKCVSAHLKALV